MVKKAIVLSSRLTFMLPSRKGKIDTKLKILVGQTISHIQPSARWLHRKRVTNF